MTSEENELPRILVVDDTSTDIQVLVQILKEEGDFVINVAKNGLLALKQMEKTVPDLVLLDIMMPEMDGNETCKRMKQTKELADIPVIFLTAKDETKDLVKAFEVGAVDYVTKPYSPPELMARVRTQLELKKSYDRIREQVSLLSRAEAILTQKLQEMEADLESAKIVQRSLLPHECPTHENYKIAFRYRPMEVVGGDYICFPLLYNNEQGFFVGDLTGHGVSAALYMTLIKFITDSLFTSCSCDPQALLTQLNSKLFGQLSSSFITAIYGVVRENEDGESHQCELAGAGHPRPILYDQQRHSYQDLSNGPAIGIFPDFDTNNYSLKLRKGSRLYLYTDGLTESENADGVELGSDHFLKIVENSFDPCVEKTLDNILENVDGYRGNQGRSDDITIFVLEIDPKVKSS